MAGVPTAPEPRPGVSGFFTDPSESGTSPISSHQPTDYLWVSPGRLGHANLIYNVPCAHPEMRRASVGCTSSVPESFHLRLPDSPNGLVLSASRERR